MKKHLNYWLALLLPALNACTDDNDTMPGDEPGTAGTPTVVSASIGNEPDTRAQVQYGTKKASDGEFFMWNAGDKFQAYDISTAEAGTPPTAYTFNIDGYYDEERPSKQADFPGYNGDKIAAFYAHDITDLVTVTGANGRKGIQAVLKSSSTPQTQTAAPSNADLKHLQDQLCMYAIGEADGSGCVSPLSFRHLSALFRITIRNQKSDEVKIHSTSITFIQGVICTKKKVTIWDDNAADYEVAENDKQHMATDTLNTNGQNFATIAPGSSYDCFITAMPVAKEGNTVPSIGFWVMFDGDTSPTTLTLSTDFKIEAGMRYWFDLTIIADGTLETTKMQTDYAWYAQDKDATEYSISTPRQLRALARLVNGDPEALDAADVSGPVDFQGKTIRLTYNIDLASKAWEPIGADDTKPFRGTFEGNGRHISGLTVNNGSNNYAGLFGWVGGKVSNLRVSGTVKTTGQMAGGIAGNLVSGSTVENCIFNGDVSGTSYVGGIAGLNDYGTITGCYTKGSVEATNSSAGGIAGSSGSRNSISHCYATGSVSGIWNIGGIIGNHSGGTVENCIALNPALTRTSGNDTQFGRIAGWLGTDPMNSPTLTSCSAYEGMTIEDAGGNDIYASATGEHGDALTAAQCLTAATYTGLGFTADASGWAFDTATTWTYLPWNKAFESFSGIQPADYRISVPRHITDALAN